MKEWDRLVDEGKAKGGRSNIPSDRPPNKPRPPSGGGPSGDGGPRGPGGRRLSRHDPAVLTRSTRVGPPDETEATPDRRRVARVALIRELLSKGAKGPVRDRASRTGLAARPPAVSGIGFAGTAPLRTVGVR